MFSESVNCHHSIKEETGSERFKWILKSTQWQAGLGLWPITSIPSWWPFKSNSIKVRGDTFLLFQKHSLSIYLKPALFTTLPLFSAGWLLQVLLLILPHEQGLPTSPPFLHCFLTPFTLYKFPTCHLPYLYFIFTFVYLWLVFPNRTLSSVRVGDWPRLSSNSQPTERWGGCGHWNKKPVWRQSHSPKCLGQWTTGACLKDRKGMGLLAWGWKDPRETYQILFTNVGRLQPRRGLWTCLRGAVGGGERGGSCRAGLDSRCSSLWLLGTYCLPH